MQLPFDNLVKSVLSMKLTNNSYTAVEPYNDELVTEVELLKLYKKVTDKLILKIFQNNVDDDRLIKSFKKLTSIQRKIVLIHILMDFSADTTAYMLGTTKNSVYAQKSKALKQLKTEMKGAI